jgi:hypothetical protein
MNTDFKKEAADFVGGSEAKLVAAAPNEAAGLPGASAPAGHGVDRQVSSVSSVTLVDAESDIKALRSLFESRMRVRPAPCMLPLHAHARPRSAVAACLPCVGRFKQVRGAAGGLLGF